MDETTDMAGAPNYRWENKRFLLNIIKKQLGITDEDIQSPSVVKAKVREAKIEEVLAN